MIHNFPLGEVVQIIPGVKTTVTMNEVQTEFLWKNMHVVSPSEQYFPEVMKLYNVVQTFQSVQTLSGVIIEMKVNEQNFGSTVY